MDDEMDDLENSLQHVSKDVRDDVLEKLEERWSSLVPLYQQAKNSGLNFISQTSEVNMKNFREEMIVDLSNRSKMNSVSTIVLEEHSESWVYLIIILTIIY